MSMTDRTFTQPDLDDVLGPERPDGPACAALVAAGVGCLAVGVFTTAAEASESFAQSLAYSSAVGPLSGKTILAVVVWLLSWVVLHVVLRGRTYPVTRALVVCLALTAVGFALTFPPVFEVFA